jgi:hypothetical protein
MDLSQYDDILSNSHLRKATFESTKRLVQLSKNIPVIVLPNIALKSVHPMFQIDILQTGARNESMFKKPRKYQKAQADINELVCCDFSMELNS